MVANEKLSDRILVADDQPDVLEALRFLLKPEGYQIEVARSPATVVQKLEQRDFALVLMDLNYARDTTSGREGLELLRKVQAIDPSLPVVVMTAWGNAELALEAIQLGAREFVTKPWDNAGLVALVRQQIDHDRSIDARRSGRRRVLPPSDCGANAEAAEA